MKVAPFGYDGAVATAGQKEPSAEETLQLVEAFNRIMDPELKAEILALAERYAGRNPKYVEELLRRQRKH